MKKNRITGVLWIVTLLAVFVGLSACGSRVTPPGANIIFGNLVMPEGIGGSYTLLRWQEGLVISIVDDSQGAHESSGSGSTEDTVWIGQGSISNEDGEGISWRVETADGKTAQFYIDEQPYDLTEGTLFLIETSSASPQIMQYQSGHNGTCSDDESCQQLLKQEPEVLQFVQETLQRSGSPSQDEADPQEAPITLPSTATSDALAPDGWSTHTSQRCEYAISYPSEMQVTSQNSYSQIFRFELADPDGVARNFIYVSVIAPEIQGMVEQGVYNHEVYNYDPIATETLLNMQIGESKPVHMSPQMEPWFTYTRMPDTQVGAHIAQSYENARPWEFPDGTREIRYYITMSDCMYLIGGYMDTTGSNLPGTITEDLFHRIVATVKLNP